MNQQTILQNNLLDMIFENRSKDYGAYLLRKTYQSRLSPAVSVTVSAVICLSLFLSYQKSVAVPGATGAGTFMPGNKISGFHAQPQPVARKMVMKHLPIKSPGKVERRPIIVSFPEINSLPATPGEILPSVTRSIPGMNLATEGNNISRGVLNTTPAFAESPETAGPNPVEIADISPDTREGCGLLFLF